MFTSSNHKNTRAIILLTVLLQLSNILSAQTQKTPLFVSVHKEVSESKNIIVYTSSEFNDAIEVDTLPHQIDTSQIIISQEILVAIKDTVTTKPFIAEAPVAVKDTVATKQMAAETSDNRIFQDSTCIDLAFDSVSIIKITEKYIEIEYSIINKGTAPAPIFGSKRAVTDNVAVHFYFSGTPRLNRGSILAEGIYLTEGLRETKGMLAPNAVYKNRFKLPLEKKNRFYGVVILQLDAFDVIRHECDETNNNFSIIPKWY